jgi:hypothetical protein
MKAMNNAHKIVGSLLSENKPLQRSYEAVYSTTDPIINDHRVYGVVIVPGSFHLARLFAVMYYCYNIPSFTITEIKFTNPLAIKDNTSVKVTMNISQENDSSYSFKIASDSVAHATGMLTVGSYSDLKLSDEAALTKKEVSIDKFDAYFKRCHLTYGPGYKWLVTLFATDFNALCYMRGPSPNNEVDGLVLHPGQIDCSFQVFLGIMLPLAEASNSDDAWILGGINQIKIYKKPHGKIKCKNVMLNHNDFTYESRKIVGDIAYYDENNDLIADFIGVVAVKVSADKLKMSASL